MQKVKTEIVPKLKKTQVSAKLKQSSCNQTQNLRLGRTKIKTQIKKKNFEVLYFHQKKTQNMTELKTKIEK